MQYFWDHYCPDKAERASPLLSPLRLASAAGLPPMLMLVGDLDVLHDECLAYAEKLEASCVPVELRIDQGMLHGYFGLTEWAEPAREALDTTIGWIKARAAETNGQNN
jgi:acetyl esterase